MLPFKDLNESNILPQSTKITQTSSFAGLIATNDLLEFLVIHASYALLYFLKSAGHFDHSKSFSPFGFHCCVLLPGPGAEQLSNVNFDVNDNFGGLASSFTIIVINHSKLRSGNR